jgi:hypothetical protein
MTLAKLAKTAKVRKNFVSVFAFYFYLLGELGERISGVGLKPDLQR